MSLRTEDFGYCGAACAECNIYRSMHYGEELKQETIDRWRRDAKEFWNVENLEPENLNCRGCRNEHEGLFFGFKLCPVKPCIREKGYDHCGMCPEMAVCQFLDPEGRNNLINLINGDRR